MKHCFENKIYKFVLLFWSPTSLPGDTGGIFLTMQYMGPELAQYALLCESFLFSDFDLFFLTNTGGLLLDNIDTAGLTYNHCLVIDPVESAPSCGTKYEKRG